MTKSLPFAEAGWTGLAAVVLGVMVLVGSGCSSAPYYRGPTTLEVASDDAANRDLPVAVEIVQVYDRALVDSLASFSAQEWFQRREALAWQHPDGFRTWRWEWTPGQSVPRQTLPMRFFTKATFVYAGYRSPGPHRAQVPPFRSVELDLNKKGFQARVLR